MANKVNGDELHRVVVQCIVYRGDPREYFIMFRTDRHSVWPSRWTIPGGGVEPKKDYSKLLKRDRSGAGVLERTVRREILEETGMRVGALRYISSTPFVRPDNIRVISIRFAARYAGGSIRLDPKDSKKFRWIRARTAASYDLIGTTGNDIGRMGNRFMLRRPPQRRKRPVR